MANYDYGGGCPCGLYRECPPGCVNYTPDTDADIAYLKVGKKMKLDESNDFGFSLVSETELKSHEEQLKKEIEKQSRVVKQTEEQYTDKLHGLRDMIMPLLNNLAKDPEKTYILWPDRSAKIKAFIEKINKYVDG